MGQISGSLWTRKMQKGLQLTPTGVSAPWTPTGSCASDPRYWLALRACHGIQLNHVQF